ncbi:MAG: helix-turn-helix transcriptional regulator, partial [Eubacteriales bacterium]|nr:helix-turn-helix transcriptional regulator [Eubacteriales bacterium]
MDCEKIGKLIATLRKEKGLTQKALAELLYVSDRAVSKWERGLGCPEVSLLPALSGALEVDLEKMLEGELSPNSADGGNMKRIQFYMCP